MVKKLHFIRATIKSYNIYNKLNLLMIIVCLLLLMVTVNIYFFSQRDLVEAINNNVEYRTFMLAYPLDRDINALVVAFEENDLIENLSFEAVEGFNTFFVTYIIHDYRDRAIIDQQFLDFSDAISPFDSNDRFESTLIIKVVKYIQLFLVFIILLTVGLLYTVITRILKELKAELSLLSAFGFNVLSLFLVSFINVLLLVSTAYWIAFAVERLILRAFLARVISNSTLFSSIEIKWFLTLGHLILVYSFIVFIISIQLMINLKKRQAIETFKDII